MLATAKKDLITIMSPTASFTMHAMTTTTTAKCASLPDLPSHENSINTRSHEARHQAAEVDPAIAD